MLVAASMALLVACGPNAWPREGAAKVGQAPLEQVQAAGTSAPGTGAPSTAASVPAPSAPAVQIFGGQPRLAGRLLFVKDGNLWRWQDGSAHEIGAGWTWRQPR